MATYEERLKSFSIELYKVNSIKFGDFKTKIGLWTPVYCDLRVIVSYPKLMDQLASLLLDYMGKLSNNFDIICGVPYTALPIATAVSLKANIPMVIRRKEHKDYGTKKMIEGHFNAGNICLIIEDVVTSGSSILETSQDLINSGIKCTDAIVLLNREQGGLKLLKEKGIQMHALLTLTELMQNLKEANCIDESVVSKVLDYISNNQVEKKPTTKSRLQLDYLSRVSYAKNPVAQQLLKLMAEKQTNLCLAADLTTTTDILNLAEQIGPHICLLKTHIDIITDFHPNFLKRLQEIAANHNFILFEDKKFGDIGKTVELQYSEGLYQISSWANLVTAHSITGKGVLDAIKQSPGVKERGVFLLAETSAAGNLIDSNYTQATLKLALDYPELITGIVCQNALFLDNPGFLQLTPGVQLGSVSDNLSQQYNSPETVMLEKGADIAVVGRGITQAADPALAAENYKSLLWAAYSKRI